MAQLLGARWARGLGSSTFDQLPGVFCHIWVPACLERQLAEPEQRFGGKKNKTPNLWFSVLAVVKPPFRNWPQNLTELEEEAGVRTLFFTSISDQKDRVCPLLKLHRSCSPRRGDKCLCLLMAKGTLHLLTLS